MATKKEIDNRSKVLEAAVSQVTKQFGKERPHANGRSDRY